MDLHTSLSQTKLFLLFRLEKQILELELTYQEQRTRLVAEMRAENERVASGLSEREKAQKASFGKHQCCDTTFKGQGIYIRVIPI